MLVIRIAACSETISNLHPCYAELDTRLIKRNAIEITSMFGILSTPVVAFISYLAPALLYLLSIFTHCVRICSSKLIVIIFPTLAFAQDHKFTFEPTDCAIDDDRLYFQLSSGFRFGVPVDNILRLNWGGGAINGVNFPDNTSIGCMQNPVIIESMRLKLSFEDENILYNRNWRPVKFTVSRFSGAHFSLQSYNRIVSGRNKNFIEISDELEIYRGEPGAGYGPMDGGSFIRAKKDVYPLFMGLRFIVGCLPAIRRGVGKNCRVGYGIQDGLYVGYQFWGQRYVEERDVLELDRAILGYLYKHCTNQQSCSALNHWSE